MKRIILLLVMMAGASFVGWRTAPVKILAVDLSPIQFNPNSGGVTMWVAPKTAESWRNNKDCDWVEIRSGDGVGERTGDKMLGDANGGKVVNFTDLQYWKAEYLGNGETLADFYPDGIIDFKVWGIFESAT